MPPPPTTPPATSPELLAQIVELLAKPPRVDGFHLDTDYFSTTADLQTQRSAARFLLPRDYGWRSIEPTRETKPRLVPLQLCEFLAYKTALAYESEQRITRYLTECCSGHTHPKFFNSAGKDASEYGKLADAQGFGFVFERKAFVIFRGTLSKRDWKINSTDALTDDLFARKDRRLAGLREAYGPLLEKLGDPEPGRHVGFSIAWAAIKDQVEDWLAERFENRDIDQIVYAGHSLGGAMAQIAAFDHARVADAIGKDRNIRIDHIAAVVTFGAPAVGSHEFVDVYKGLLGSRTVILESSGDLVPRIMNRWYYRWLYPLRQRVKSGVQLHLQATDGYGKVATPWSFSSEPPLSKSDIDSAVSTLRDAAQKAMRDLAEQHKDKVKELSKNEKEKEAQKTGTNSSGDGKPVDTSSDGSLKPTNPAATAPEPVPTWVYWLFIGLAAGAVTGVAWYFVRRKLFSHDIEQRYALYLSTLSYQQLRAKHGGNVELANAELAEHLRFIRGDLDKGIEIAKETLDEKKKPTPFFDSVLGLPVPIAVQHDPVFVEYLKRNETFV